MQPYINPIVTMKIVMSGTIGTGLTNLIATMIDTTEPEHPKSSLNIRAAVRDDCGLILEFIKELAEYEKLAHQVTATSEDLENTLFSPTPSAEVIIAEWNHEPAGFALFFGNYSTFLAKPGIYLEDLYVRPEFRGNGIGTELLKHLAALVISRNGGRLDWWVLDWNTPSIEFYKNIGARDMNEWVPMRLQGEALIKLASHKPD